MYNIRAGKHGSNIACPYSASTPMGEGHGVVPTLVQTLFVEAEVLSV